MSEASACRWGRAGPARRGVRGRRGVVGVQESGPWKGPAEWAPAPRGVIVRRGMSQVMLTSLLTAAVTVAMAGVAMAVSGGGYQPSQQDCPASADANNVDGTSPGCHNFKLNVENGRGRRYAEVGLDQLPKGSSTPGLFGVGMPGSSNFPHAGCVAVNTSGTKGGSGRGCGTNQSGAGFTAVFDTENTARNAIAPQTGAPDPGGLLASLQDGLVVYLGADDNLDAGEHDGVDGSPLTGTAHSVNGPSDGGAVTAHVTPGAATTSPSLHDPVPAAGAGEGACADGLCQEVTTQRQQAYRGNPKGKSSRDVSNYGGKKWDPYNCSSGDLKSEQACPGGMDSWRNAEAHSVYAEPGVQVYEDPDPQASPIDPLYEAGATPQPSLYPIPAAYVGTCGVVAGGGPVASAPAGTPSTNSAGQVVVSTGC